MDRAELDRRAGRDLSREDIATLVDLGAITLLDNGRVRLHGTTVLSTGIAVLDSALPTHLWQHVHQLIEQHTTALAEDLMKLFQDEILQPYRDRGRPADERGQLAAALSQLKPVTMRGVMTAFGRAVNKTIRERIG
jgi:hypothetical protein